MIGRFGLIHEGSDLGGGGGQAGKIKGDAANECVRGSGGRWFEPGFFEPCENKGVDGALGARRSSRAHGRHVTPVRLRVDFVGPLRSGGDPFAQVTNFDGSETIAALRHGFLVARWELHAA